MRCPLRFTAASLLLLPFAAAAAASPTTNDRLSPQWVDRWRSDLAFAADSLPRAHPAFFRHLSRADYEAELSALADRLPALSQSEAVVELGRIIGGWGTGTPGSPIPSIHRPGSSPGTQTRRRLGSPTWCSGITPCDSACSAILFR